MKELSKLKQDLVINNAGIVLLNPDLCIRTLWWRL